tara:strand:+ start:173 stop:430 length:258 start_codon:yes stop_codon:yes gene_type:complete
MQAATKLFSSSVDNLLGLSQIQNKEQISKTSANSNKISLPIIGNVSKDTVKQVIIGSSLAVAATVLLMNRNQILPLNNLFPSLKA